ncbi:acyl-CoA carboxylase subunit epsilon [Pseudarthrobacter sp. J64]|uniref:acyl-CoA carboxylase subunit epsilon n=1 Tax=Pseudarthrobacter sp. J64 TaxID=3116485 RepID=UPI003FA743A6
MTAEEPVVEPVETEPVETAPVETAPVLSVVKGNPTPEELAALTAVVLSLPGSETAAPLRPSTRHWVRRQQLRLAPTPGPGAWRRSRG